MTPPATLRSPRQPRSARWQVALLFLLAVLLLPGPVQAQETEPLTVSASEQIMGNIATLQQDIHVEGTVQGDVTSWVGTIEIDGYVTGDVVSYGGTVLVGPTARVDGSVLVLAGSVTRPDENQIGGQFISDDVLRLVPADITPPDNQSLAAPVAWLRYLLLSATLTVLTIALGGFSALIWPERADRASTILIAQPWRAWALGLVTTLLFLLLLAPLFVLLALSLVGLPLILVGLLCCQLPFVYGLVILAQSLCRPFVTTKSKSNNRISLVLLLPVLLLLLLPVIIAGAVSLIWSTVLFYLLASAGVGAVLLSRDQPALRLLS